VNDDPSLSTADVAQKLGVTRQTVSRWIRAGRLHAVRIAVAATPSHEARLPANGIYRIRPSAFAAFVRQYVRDE
jgi:predicted site-specific integrase-resolvase